MVKSSKISSSHCAEDTAPSSQEVALRVASCNLQADLDLEKFDPTLRIMVEFLKSHPLQKPLTKSIEFPLSIIHRAYSTSVYNSDEEYIEFDVNEDNTTRLFKVEFLKAIGLPASKEKRTFYEPTNAELLDVLDQIGYLPPRLEQLASFKKSKPSAMWQFLVDIIVRCLTGKTGGMDQVNRPVLVLLFGIYTGKEVDFGTTIWKDFASYVFPKKKEIPCARFWALALRRGYTMLKIPLPEGEEMFTPHTISKYAIPDQSDFGKVARLPEAMLQYIDDNSEVLIKHREETGPQEPEHPTQSSPPIRPTEGHTSSPKRKKQIALNIKKITGLGTKRKSETITAPDAKRLPTQYIPTYEKVKDDEEIPTIGTQSSTPLMSNDEMREEVEKKDVEKEQLATKRVTRSMQTYSESREAEAKKEEEGKELERMLREELQKKEEEERVRIAAKLLEQAMSEGLSTEIGEDSAEAMEEDFVFTTDEGLIQDSESKVFLGTSGTESKPPTMSGGLSTKTGEESAEAIEEDFVFTIDEGLVQDCKSPPIMESFKPSKSRVSLGTSEIECESPIMSAGLPTKTGDKSAEATEEDFVFSSDEGLIQDAESPPIMESVKPSKSKVFLGTLVTENEHRDEVPKGETKTLPTTVAGPSTPRRRTKGKKKKNSKYVTRVEFDSLSQKLCEVLEVVKKISPSQENFVSNKDFGELQKIVTSLAESVLNLQTREKSLRESIVNCTADALRDMEHKRTEDTFKYLDRMDEMLKMVNEIQESYDGLTITTGHQHGDEIARLSEQLRDYRNKNIILEAVLVKVMQSAHQLLTPCNIRLDEVLFAIQKLQNYVDVLPKTLFNVDLSKQVRQSFLKR